MAYVAFADGRGTWRTADGAFAARRHCRLAGAAHGDIYGTAENPRGTKRSYTVASHAEDRSMGWHNSWMIHGVYCWSVVTHGRTALPEEIQILRL